MAAEPVRVEFDDLLRRMEIAHDGMSVKNPTKSLLRTVAQVLVQQARDLQAFHAAEAQRAEASKIVLPYS